MNDQRNRDRPASTLTKREHAALELYARNEMSVAAAVRAADLLFDELDTPHELRGYEQELQHVTRDGAGTSTVFIPDHEGTP